MARKILANLHPCDDAHCSRRATPENSMWTVREEKP